VGFSPSGPVKANRGVRARVPAAEKVLEGDDQRTLSPLYYDVMFCRDCVILINTKPVLSQAKPRDAAINLNKQFIVIS